MKEIKLPKKFSERLVSQIGEEAFESFQQAFQDKPPVSLRVNPVKAVGGLFEEEERVPWCTPGRYLPKRPPFYADPLIFAGAYYVQEASSMFLWHALQTHAPLDKPIKALDLCAAPGGKSTLILSAISSDSLLVSNELVGKRTLPLMENISRWGHDNALVSSNEASHYVPLKEFFDVITVDAPCSGEGMFRKDPKAMGLWSPQLVKSCASIQHDILDDIKEALKPSGLLVYSTCTFGENENEERLRQLAETDEFEPLRLPLQEDWNVTELSVEHGGKTYYGYRFIFHKTKGEGLFLSCFRKKGDEEDARKPKVSKKKQQQISMLSKKDSQLVAEWLTQGEEYVFPTKGDEIYAIPKKFADDYKALAATVNIIMPGVKIGKLNKKNGQLVPTHELAISNIVKPSIPRVELDYDQAIAYLKKQAIEFDTQNLKEWVIVTYKGIALGWVKILPNRINNYYPSELRLRKDV